MKMFKNDFIRAQVLGLRNEYIENSKSNSQWPNISSISWKKPPRNSKQYRMQIERYGDDRGGILVSYTQMHTHILNWLILLRILYVRNLKYIRFLNACVTFSKFQRLLLRLYGIPHMHLYTFLPP